MQRFWGFKTKRAALKYVDKMLQFSGMVILRPGWGRNPWKSRWAVEHAGM